MSRLLACTYHIRESLWKRKRHVLGQLVVFFFGFIRQAYLEIMAETKRAARNSETMGTSAWWVFKVSLELCVSVEPVEVT